MGAMTEEAVGGSDRLRTEAAPGIPVWTGQGSNSPALEAKAISPAFARVGRAARPKGALLFDFEAEGDATRARTLHDALIGRPGAR